MPFLVRIIAVCKLFTHAPGYIDLSKRRVAPEEIAKCEERYNKSKAVCILLFILTFISDALLSYFYLLFSLIAMHINSSTLFSHH